jgi:hypothetical protein
VAVGAAAIYDGARRMQAGEVGGVTLQVVRDCGLRFNACPLADYFKVGNLC